MKIRFWHLLVSTVFLFLIIFISPLDLSLNKSIEFTGIIFFMIGLIIITIQLFNNVVLDTKM